MIAPKDSIDSQSTETPLPNGASGASDMEGKAATGSGERDESRSSFNSKKVYVGGKVHTDLRVPFREILLAPTKSMNGEIEVNDPVRVYDTSGPWGDADFHGDVTQGLPALRAKWIRDRGDVEEIDGREVQPIDDGFLSEKHAAIAAQHSTPNAQRPTSNGAGAPSRRRPLRASVGHPVTQLAYARRGIITAEMEFIAIRENMGHEANRRSGFGQTRDPESEIRNKFEIRNSKFLRPSTLQLGIARNDLAHQHSGNSFGAKHPRRDNT